MLTSDRSCSRTFGAWFETRWLAGNAKRQPPRPWSWVCPVQCHQGSGTLEQAVCSQEGLVNPRPLPPLHDTKRRIWKPEQWTASLLYCYASTNLINCISAGWVWFELLYVTTWRWMSRHHTDALARIGPSVISSSFSPSWISWEDDGSIQTGPGTIPAGSGLDSFLGIELLCDVFLFDFACVIPVIWLFFCVSCVVWWPIGLFPTGRPVCLYSPTGTSPTTLPYPCNLSPVASSFYSCPLNFFCLD